MLSKNNIRESIFALKNQLKPQEAGYIAFFRNGEKYRPYKISKNYFRKIEKPRNLKERKIAFIDGGNNSLLSAPNFCVVANRLNFSLYRSNVRLKPKIPATIDFISVCTSVAQKNEIYFNVEILSKSPTLKDIRTIKISSVDKSISSGLYRAKISKIADVARKYAEWCYARKIAEEQLDEGDIILRDGTLEARFTGEVDFADAAYKACMEKNITFAGLAKTTTLFTNTGANFAAVLNLYAPKDRIWRYYPVADIDSKYHRAEMIFSKLHKKSKRILRVDVFNESKCDMDELFYLLADNSKDPCFFGYPYGLIEAHKMALITNKEAQYYKTMASVYLGKSALSDLNSQNGHNELDKAV